MNRKGKTRMDNLFDYLIILFFIFSAFGSLFKKKPQQKAGTAKTQTLKRDKNYTMNPERVYKDPFDIDSPKPTETDKENYNYFDSLSTKEDSFEKSVEFSEPVKTPEEKQTTAKKIKVRSDENILYASELKSDIKRKLKNINSVREAILLSEILNKPKALRYSGKNIHY
jgi:hypothetical protein